MNFLSTDAPYDRELPILRKLIPKKTALISAVDFKLPVYFVLIPREGSGDWRPRSQTGTIFENLL